MLEYHIRTRAHAHAHTVSLTIRALVNVLSSDSPSLSAQAAQLEDHQEVASYGIKNSFHPETSSTVTLRVDEAAEVPKQHDPDYIAASQVVAGAAATGWRCRVKCARRHRHAHSDWLYGWPPFPSLSLSLSRVCVCVLSARDAAWWCHAVVFTVVFTVGFAAVV